MIPFLILSFLSFIHICNGQGQIAPHPRLILTPDRIDFLSSLSHSNDPFAKLFVKTTLSQAETILLSSTKTSPYYEGVAAPNARDIVQSIYTLGVSAALTGNASFINCGVDIFLRAALNPSWDVNNTIPELNTGEMFHAIGLGLDWFYDALSPANRSAVVSAISERLSLIRDALSSTPPSWAVAFVNTSSNWNMVILGGAVISSLAIDGEPDEPSFNDNLRRDVINNIKTYSARAWSPSGSWPEGLNYGGYTTRYITPLVASLLSSTGDDAGILSIPGVLQSPRWLIANTVPTRPFPELWDYFDTRKTPETIASYLAVAVWANDAPAAAGIKKLLTQLSPSIPYNDTETTAMNAPLSCLYYSTLGSPEDENQLPVISNWQGPSTAAMRSSWEDENATFIGFKGHNVSMLWAHSHLDAGSFVFATQGQFFAQDMSSDSYAAPGYFSPSRFNLYRTNISGHNTISFGGRNPLCKIIATYSSNCPPSPMILLNVTNDQFNNISAYSIVNLTDGFISSPIPGVQRVERGFIVTNGRTQLVTVDEVDFDAKSPTMPIWWTLHTVANVTIQNLSTVTLSTWNTTAIIKVSILNASNCIDAQFTVSSLNLEPPLLPSPGVNVIRIIAPNASSCNKLIVAVGENPPSFHNGIRPLNEWQEYGPQF